MCRLLGSFTSSSSIPNMAIAQPLGSMFYDMAHADMAAECFSTEDEEDVVLEPQEKKVKVSLASSVAAHGASLDAASTTTAPASMSIPAAQASLDKRGRRILEDWVAPLREVVQPMLLALGSQQRALVIDELLSGTCSAVYSLLAAEVVHIRHRLMVEKNAEAVKFCRDQVGSAEYYVPLLQSLSHDHPAPWTPADLLVAGIVCKPFSTANAKRRQAGSVESHPDFGIGSLVVDYILERLPWMFLLENVLGWGQKMCPEETGPSAMEAVEKRFLASGIYKVLTLELGTDAWSQGRRTSFFMVGVRSALTDASSDAAQQRFTEKLQAIVLRRAARRPAHWDEWLLHPGDSGYCMMLARYASEGQRCKMELAKACKDHAFTYLI